MIDEELDTPTLADLVRDWIKNDPVLSAHFTVIEAMDAFYIHTTCSGVGKAIRKERVAWFEQNGAMSTWLYLDDELIKLNPADRKFFDEIRKHLCNAHNGLAHTTAKGNIWHTPRYGCKYDIA